MLRTLPLTILGLAVCLAPVQPTAAATHPDDPITPPMRVMDPTQVPNRGDIVQDGPGVGTQLRYTRKRAVIIGINYTPKDSTPLSGPTSPGTPKKLDNAENDAIAVCKLLVDCYGYKQEDVRLLLGTGKLPGLKPGESEETHSRIPQPIPATRENIVKELGRKFLCDEEFGKLDTASSVLVYYSGHGVVEPIDGGFGKRGYLVPVDGDVTLSKDGKYAHNTTLIKISEELVNPLRTECKARHKLLILDSCHSGVVFRIDEGPRVSNTLTDLRANAGSFDLEGFQVITAGMETQLVSDGPKGGHSPFTTNLLNALASIPRRRTTANESFTAAELFKTMSAYQDSQQLVRQSLDCRSLDAKLGEFYFCPDSNAGDRWPKSPEMDEKGRNQLIAVVPSTLGNWWADEMIWFMPGLRYEILSSQPTTRSAEAYLDPDLIRRVAVGLSTAPGKAVTETQQRRYRHLRLLLDTREVAQKVKAMDEVIEDLRRVADCPCPEPAGADPKADRPAPPKSSELVTLEDRMNRALDLHYLAVLLQKRGGPDNYKEASQRYQDAIKLYESLPGAQQLHPLHALCRMDHGILCVNNLGKHREAIAEFAKARELVGPDAPVSFTVFTLYREAQAARKLGVFGVSDNRLVTARDMAVRTDPFRTQPMTAAVYKNEAWACMELCQFKKAQDAFRECREILTRLDTNTPNSFPIKIELLHVDHGLAMSERFQGQDKQAVEKFRKLTHEVANCIRELDNQSQVLGNYVEVRQLLCERYVNSLERQGDCWLFGQTPDYAEAADDYRRALRAVGNTPEDRREATTLDILYRLVIALSMPSPAQDLTLAGQLYDEAGRIEVHLREVYKAETVDGRTRVCRAIAKLLLSHHSPRSNPADPTELSHSELINLVREFSPPITQVGSTNTNATRGTKLSRLNDRDELERLMFGCSLLLRHQKAWGIDPGTAQNCCDALLSACRLALRPTWVRHGELDIEFLGYLRRYYDQAFEVKAARTPVPVKELIAIAAEATRGEPYYKPAKLDPILTYYRANNQGYLLLDTPPGRDYPGSSVCCVLGKEWNDKDLVKDACSPGRTLPLPDEIRRAVAGLKGSGIEVRWRDPVTGLGYEKDWSVVRAAGPRLFGVSYRQLTSSGYTTTRDDRGELPGCFPFTAPRESSISFSNKVESDFFFAVARQGRDVQVAAGIPQQNLPVPRP